MYELTCLCCIRSTNSDTLAESLLAENRLALCEQELMRKRRLEWGLKGMSNALRSWVELF